MPRKKSAGGQLRDHLNAALKEAGEEVGKTLEWTHQEAIAIERAVTTAESGHRTATGSLRR